MLDLVHELKRAAVFNSLTELNQQTRTTAAEAADDAQQAERTLQLLSAELTRAHAETTQVEEAADSALRALERAALRDDAH